MKPKIYTIWKYAMMFGPSKSWLEKAVEADEVVFFGKIDEMPYETAKTVCEVHPSYMEYYQDAMAPLFKGYGYLKNGTESPNLAIASRRNKKEKERGHDCVVIWKTM